MLDSSPTLDWPAIVLATLAYYLLGALWFTPLLGRAWDRAVGFSRPRGHRFPTLYYVMPLISSVLVTLATAVLVDALDARELAEALTLGAVVGIGYAAAVSFNNAVTPTTPQPLLLGAVTAGYHVVGITLVAVVLASV